MNKKATCLKVTALIALASPWATAAEPEQHAAGKDPDSAVRSRAQELVARMTPAEKAGQLSQYFHFPGTELTDDRVISGSAGSLLFVSDPAEVNRLQRLAVERSRLGIPLMFAFDVVHGLRTIFPVPIGMAASWDPAMVEQAQSVAAREASAVGIRWTFAPNVDIARDPRWGRIVEGAGEDPFLGAAMAAAQVRGFQGTSLDSPGRILAGAKHFVGYGASLGGRDYDEVNLSDSELHNVYLPPFKAAIDAGAQNIMSAYMPVNGIPAAGNRWLLHDLLRGELGFKGFVVGDNRSVLKLVTQGLAENPRDAAVRAIKAGVDMEMNLMEDTSAMHSLPEALASGQVSVQEVDKAVLSVLEAKIKLGLFEHPYVDEASTKPILSDPQHLELARVAAERAAVLLRNDGDVLPIDSRKVRSIAVIGPFADAPEEALGSWAFQQNNPVTSSILAGIREKAGSLVNIGFAQGVQMPRRHYPSPFTAANKAENTTNPFNESEGIQRAVELARRSDVSVMVLGEAQDMSGESASRSSLDLPGHQQALLDAVVATGKPVVLVLMSARPLDLKGTQANAILNVWYPGSAAGEAVANLIFGSANPGGKLPFNWIRSASQAPNPYAYLLSHEPENSDKRYWEGTSQPMWPFGFGLSYTNFSYTKLRISASPIRPGGVLDVEVDVTNTGSRAGDEVVQLYVHQRYGTSARPVRELKGFRRVSLAAGETRTVRISVPTESLRYWSQATRGWVQDDAPFDLWVGGSSAAGLSAQFSVRK